MLCGLHTQPTNANYELGNMSLVIDAVKAKWNETVTSFYLFSGIIPTEDMWKLHTS